MRTTNNTFLKIAVLAVGVRDIGGGAASPALADIRDAMPAVSASTIQMVASVPQITQIIPAVFFGQLVQVVKKKTLFTIGCLFSQPIAYSPLLKVLGYGEGKPAFALSAAGYAILIVIVVAVTLFSPKASADRRLKSEAP